MIDNFYFVFFCGLSLVFESGIKFFTRKRCKSTVTIYNIIRYYKKRRKHNGADRKFFTHLNGNKLINHRLHRKKNRKFPFLSVGTYFENLWHMNFFLIFHLLTYRSVKNYCCHHYHPSTFSFDWKNITLLSIYSLKNLWCQHKLFLEPS